MEIKRNDLQISKTVTQVEIKNYSLKPSVSEYNVLTKPSPDFSDDTYKLKHTQHVRYESSRASSKK